MRTGHDHAHARSYAADALGVLTHRANGPVDRAATVPGRRPRCVRADARMLNPRWHRPAACAPTSGVYAPRELVHAIGNRKHVLDSLAAPHQVPIREPMDPLVDGGGSACR